MLKETRNLLLPFVMSGALFACSSNYVEHKTDRGIPEGPGLLTGEKGYFGSTEEDRAKEKARMAASAPPSGLSVEQQQELDAYKEYKSLKEYQEFQKWKAKAQDSSEYQEFLEWKRMKETPAN